MVSGLFHRCQIETYGGVGSLVKRYLLIDMKKASKIFRDKFFGSPYKFGGQSKEDGFDCVSFTKGYYEEMGREVPDFSDLYLLYDSNPSKAKRIMWKRLFRCTREISVTNVMVGDLVIFEHESFGSYPGVWLGNGNVGASFSDKGVVVVNSMYLRIISVRRWAV
jgi:cell wall-associated NlpC family hydrolase